MAHQRLPLDLFAHILDTVEASGISGLCHPPSDDGPWPKPWPEDVSPIAAHRMRLERQGWLDDLIWRDSDGSVRMFVGMVTGEVGIIPDGYKRKAEDAVAWAERVLAVAKLGVVIRKMVVEHLAATGWLGEA